MELWQSLGYFFGGIIRRAYYWAGSFLLDPFDIYNRFLRPLMPESRQGYLDMPAELFPYVLGTALLWTAALTYHELRQKTVALQGVDEVEAAIKSLKGIAVGDTTLDVKLLEFQYELARGWDAWLLTDKLGQDRDEGQKLVGELHLLGLILEVRQQDDDVFGQGRIGFHEVKFLTELGSKVIRRLRD